MRNKGQTETWLVVITILLIFIILVMIGVVRVGGS